MKKNVLRLYLLLIILAGVTALGFLFFHPPTVGDAFEVFENAYQGEFRKMAVLLLAGFGAAAVVFASLALILSFFKEKLLAGVVDNIGELSERGKIFLILIGILVLTSFVAGQFSLPADYVEDPLHRMFLKVTRPLFLYGLTLSIGVFFLLLAVNGKMNVFLRPEFLWPALIFLVLFGMGAVLQKAGFGFKRIPGPRPQFDVSGNPLLGYQVVLAVAAAGLFFIIKRFLVKGWEREDQRSWVIFDLYAVVIILLISFLLWNSVPLQPHTFVDQPRPPNYEMYPDSDALSYDRTSQSLLAKGRLQSPLGDYQTYIGFRPGLTFFQSVLHAIGGLSYQDILPLQLLVFSFLPVLIYIFTSMIHTRAAGFFAALLVIFRDFNGQVMPHIDAGVHAKLLESEIPMIMGMLLFLILFLVWLRSERRGVLLPLLGGGILGWSMLIRLESVVLIPVISLVALVFLWDKKPMLLKACGFLVFGVILVISPWIYRNWYYTGDIYLNRPDNRIVLLKESFQRLGEEIKGEVSLIYPEEIGQNRVTPDSVNKAEVRMGQDPTQAPTITPAAEDTLNVNLESSEEGLNVSFLDHMTNNLIQSVIFLPSNPLFLNVDYLSKAAIGKAGRYYGGILYSPEKYVRSLPYWWSEWDGTIPLHSLLLVAVNLFLISNGIYVIHGREKRVLWLLILLYMIFVGGYSFISRSGGRSLQISDWVVVVFYSAGLMNVFYRGWAWWTNKSERLIGSESRMHLTLPDLPIRTRGYMIGCLALGLLFLGSLPPLAEVILPNRYPQEESETLSQYLREDRESPLPDEKKEVLDRFLRKGGTVVWGRGLYPRYFYPGEATNDTKPRFVGPMNRFDFARFEYYMAGTENIWVLLKRDSTPEYFPHGTSVLTFGCRRGGNLDALAVVLYENDDIKEIYWREGDLSQISGCPLPWPETE